LALLQTKFVPIEMKSKRKRKKHFLIDTKKSGKNQIQYFSDCHEEIRKKS